MHKQHFKNLDALRFIAASMVCICHIILPSFKFWNIEGTLAWDILSLLGSGSLGVQLFFVLSGFLITYLLINEYNTYQKISLPKFYMRRLLRIWPLYFLVLFFSFFIIPFLKSFQGGTYHFEDLPYYLSFLSNFALIHNIGSETLAKSITWSISIEEQFYVFWPLIFTFLRKRFWKYGIIAIIIISLGFKMVNVEEYIVMYFHTISLLSDLAIGGLFALLIKSNNKIKVFFENTTTLQHFFLITVAVVLFYTGNFVFNFKYGTIIHNFLISISIALIISAQAISVKKSVLHFSNIPLATKLGKYTYGIYLIHPIMYELTMLAINYYQIPNNNFINAITISLCIILMTITSSIVVYKLYESKFLKIKDKFFSN